MNTNTYINKAGTMPLESTGMFFIPAHSTNIPVMGLFEKNATALTNRGLQGFSSKATFQHIPVALECRKKVFAQQKGGIQAESPETFQTFQTLDAVTQFLAASQVLTPDFPGLISRASGATTSQSNHPQKEIHPCK